MIRPRLPLSERTALDHCRDDVLTPSWQVRTSARKRSKAHDTRKSEINTPFCTQDDRVIPQVHHLIDRFTGCLQSVVIGGSAARGLLSG